MLNAQDTVLCSYFAQRLGAKGGGCGQKNTVEEAFQGLDRFEQVLVGYSEVEHEHEGCVRKAQVSRLAMEGWSKKRDLGSGNPRSQSSGADGESYATCVAELT